MNKSYLFILSISLIFCSPTFGQNVEGSFINSSKIKTVVIPIGSNEGEITVGYLCGLPNMSSFVCPPDVFEVLHNGNLVFGTDYKRQVCKFLTNKANL